MSLSFSCDHCGADLDVNRYTVAIAEKYTNGTFVCPDCEGRHQYPADLPECDIADCEMPAPFTISTVDRDIHRCREDLRRELAGETWNNWRFYRGDG